MRLGRFAEAVASLRVAANMAEREGDIEAPLLACVQSLIEQVAGLLKRLNQEKKKCAASEVSVPSREDDKQAEGCNAKEEKDDTAEEIDGWFIFAILIAFVVTHH